MSLVSDAGSMRMFGSCDPSTWPLVASSSNQDLAAIVGVGTVWANAADKEKAVAAMAAINFFMGSKLCNPASLLMRKLIEN